MQITQVTAGGEMHGLINTLTNSVPFDDFKNFTPENKAKLQKQKKEDARVVKAEYMNSRGMHERLTKPYCKYAGDPIGIYHLIPGRTYELPLGFINEVNDSSKYIPKRAGLLAVDGESVRGDDRPLEADQQGTWLHKLVPAAF